MLTDIMSGDYLVKLVDIVGQEVYNLSCGSFGKCFAVETKSLCRTKVLNQVLRTREMRQEDDIRTETADHNQPSCRSCGTRQRGFSCRLSGHCRSRDGEGEPGRWQTGRCQQRSCRHHRLQPCQRGHNAQSTRLSSQGTLAE